jgi:hypothetical protein
MRGINDSLGVGSAFRGDKNLEDLGMYQRTGSGRNILSPTETMMSRLAEINDAANQNMIVRALRDLVLRVGGKEGAAIAEMIPNAELRALDINVENAVYKAAIANGWMAEDAKGLVRNLQLTSGPSFTGRKLSRLAGVRSSLAGRTASVLPCGCPTASMADSSSRSWTRWVHGACRRGRRLAASSSMR